jgi:hypothetical protein
MDAGNAPVRPRVDGLGLWLALLLETSLAREFLVQRLAPEDHEGSISP